LEAAWEGSSRETVLEKTGLLKAIKRFISSPGFLLFVLFVVLYVFTLKIVMATDTISNCWLPWMILRKHTVALDVLYRQVGTTYYLFPHNGHYFSVFNLGSAVAALPIYAIPSIFMGQMSMLNALLLGKISCVVLMSLSVVFIYYAARNISTRSRALRTSAFRIEGDRLHAVYVDDMDSRRKITVDADVNASSWKSPRITITK